MFYMVDASMDEELTAARLQKQELSERLQRLESDLELTRDAIERARAEYYRISGKIEVLEKISPLRPKKRNERGTTTPSRAPVINPSRTEVADAALEVIRGQGKPVGRQELFDALAARGVQIDGKNPLMVFSTMLWREQERVKRLRGYGYWIAGEPYPPAGYFPEGQPTLF